MPLRLLSLPRLARRHGRLIAFALFGLVSCSFSIAVITLVASIVRQPLVVPSLGPTAFLIFDRPRAAAATPRNIVLGHLAGLVFGWGALAVFGLTDAGPVITSSITPARAGAAALALGVTTSVMLLARFPHPPACATALIVALGFLTTALQLGALMIGVVMLAVQGSLIDRVVGLDYPLWARPGDTRPARVITPQLERPGQP